MKKILFSALALILLFVACSKSNSSKPAPYGISATINGKATTFNGFITVDTTGGQIDISGSTDTLTGGFPELEFLITPASGAVKPGLYPNQALVNPNAANSYLNYLTTPGGGISNTIQFGSYDDSLTVTSISSTAISGTFHGTADYHYFDPNALAFKDSIITITNGTFNVKFK